MTTVRQVMTEDVLTAFPDESLAQLYDRMTEKDVRHMPVVDAEDQTLLGIVSHRDLLRGRYIEQEVSGYMERSVLDRTQVREVMVSPVQSVSPETDLREAAEMMLEYKFGCLAVTDGERLLGILTESDFVSWVASGG